MTNRLLYAITVLIWGSTWYAIEFQLGVVPVEVSLAYRYLLAASLLFLWCAWRGDNLRFGWAQHKYFLLLGVFLFGINYVAAMYAQLYITSALNAIVFGTMVWLNIIFTRLFFGTRIEPRTYVGAVLGMVGLAIIFWPEMKSISLSDATLIGACLSLTGAVIASLGNMVSQGAQRRKIPVMQANAWGMLYGAIFMAGISFMRGHEFVFDWSPGYVISMLFLAVFGSVVAFGCYLTLLGRIGAHRSGYAVVMFPIVAVILSAVFEGLRLEAHIFVGLALALGGNLVILAKTGTRPAPAKSDDDAQPREDEAKNRVSGLGTEQV